MYAIATPSLCFILTQGLVIYSVFDHMQDNWPSIKLRLIDTPVILDRSRTPLEARRREMAEGIIGRPWNLVP